MSDVNRVLKYYDDEVKAAEIGQQSLRDKVTPAMESTLRNVEHHITSHPGWTVAIGLTLGVIIGCIVKRK